MAVQVVELPTQPSSTAGASIANMLEDVSNDYVQQKNAKDRRQQELDDAGTRRQNELADIQSNRAYTDERDDKEHAFQESEFDHHQAAIEKASALHRKDELKDHITEMLVNGGFLDPDRVDDPASVKAAWSAARRDGTLQKYSDLINHGYLAIDKIGDPQAVADAQAKAAKASTAAYGAAAAQKAAAAGAAGDVSSQIAAETAKIAQIEDATRQAAMVASQPPSQASVIKAATALASQTARVPGHPSQAEIQAQIPQAQATLKQQNEENAMQADQQAKILIAPHQRILASLSTRAGQFEKAGIFANPEDSAPAAPDATPALAPATGGFSQNAAALRAKLVGGQPAPGTPAPAATPGSPVGAPPSPTPAALQPLPGGASEPLIQQENQRRAAAAQTASGADWQKNLANPYDDTLDQIQQLTELANNLRNPPAVRGEIPQDPDQRAQQLAEVNAKLAALQAQLQIKKRKMLGLNSAQTLGMPATGSATAVPALSNADGSTPTPPPATAWWGGPSTGADTE